MDGIKPWIVRFWLLYQKLWAVSEQINIGKAEIDIDFPKSIRCCLGYKYIFASSQSLLHPQNRGNLGGRPVVRLSSGVTWQSFSKGDLWVSILKPSMSKCLFASCSVELMETLMWINRNEDDNMYSDCRRGCFGDCTAGTGLKLQDFTRVWFCLFLVFLTHVACTHIWYR